MVKDSNRVKVIHRGKPSGFIFLMAFIGAAIYFVNQSHGFWGFILALLKACVWPAYVVNHVLTLLHA